MQYLRRSLLKERGAHAYLFAGPESIGKSLLALRLAQALVCETGGPDPCLICRACNRMVDVDCAVGDRPCLTAADAAGYEVDEAEVIYWGRCPACVAADRSDPVPEAERAARHHHPGTAHDPAPSAPTPSTHGTKQRQRSSTT